MLRSAVRSARAARDARRMLAEVGWWRSYRTARIVGTDGVPRPWFSQPAVHLLAERVPDGVRVFEWGAGSSTEWWAQRAAEVVAVESDEAFAATLRLPANVTLRVVPVDGYGGDYPKAILDEDPFDVVVIDGRDRNGSADTCLDRLTDRGVIVFDNTDHPKYQPGCDRITAAGFRRLDLVGPTPMLDRACQTTIFYRDGNLLDL